MQVIADSNAGGRLGAALGTGLQQLAQNKLEHVMKQHEKAQYAAGVEPIVGKSVANLLNNLTPEERKAAWQNPGGLMALGKYLDQRGAAPAGGVPNLLGNGQPNQENAQPQQNDDELGRLLQNAFTPPRERREEEKLDIKRAEFERKNKQEIREYLAPFDEIVGKAENDIRDNKLLEKLAETGDLRSGVPYQILSKLGLESLGANYATQLADKLVARMAQNSSTAFGPGARITNYLERTYQRSQASLWNTDEGIKGIARINNLASDVIVKAQEIRRDLIKKNKGIPEDIEGEVKAKLQPYRDKKEAEAMKIALKFDPQRNVDEVPADYTGRVKEPSGKIVHYKNGQRVNG